MTPRYIPKGVCLLVVVPTLALGIIMFLIGAISKVVYEVSNYIIEFLQYNIMEKISNYMDKAEQEKREWYGYDK